MKPIKLFIVKNSDDLEVAISERTLVKEGKIDTLPQQCIERGIGHWAIVHLKETNHDLCSQIESECLVPDGQQGFRQDTTKLMKVTAKATLASWEGLQGTANADGFGALSQGVAGVLFNEIQRRLYPSLVDDPFFSDIWMSKPQSSEETDQT